MRGVILCRRHEDADVPQIALLKKALAWQQQTTDDPWRPPHALKRRVAGAIRSLARERGRGRVGGGGGGDDDDDDVVAVVIELGERWWRAGFAGDEAPVVTLPPCYVRTPDGRMLVGDDAWHWRHVLPLRWACPNGVVGDWDAVEALLHHVFYEWLVVFPEEHPVLFARPWFAPKFDGEKLQQVIFETFNCPAMYHRNRAWRNVLAAYSCGMDSALSVCVDYSHCYVGPIATGQLSGCACYETEIGLGHLVQLYESWLCREYPELDVSHADAEKVCLEATVVRYPGDGIEGDVVGDMRCQLVDHLSGARRACDGVGGDGDAEGPGAQAHTVTIPGWLRQQAGEAWFRPQVIGRLDVVGLGAIVGQSLTQFGMDPVPGLPLLPFGIGARVVGLRQRLRAELVKRFPALHPLRSEPAPTAAWIGGSILASLGHFQHVWLSKEEYDESGPNAYYNRRRLF